MGRGLAGTVDQLAVDRFNKMTKLPAINIIRPFYGRILAVIYLSCFFFPELIPVDSTSMNTKFNKLNFCIS